MQCRREKISQAALKKKRSASSYPPACTGHYPSPKIFLGEVECPEHPTFTLKLGKSDLETPGRITTVILWIIRGHGSFLGSKVKCPGSLWFLRCGAPNIFLSSIPWFMWIIMKMIWIAQNDCWNEAYLSQRQPYYMNPFLSEGWGLNQFSFLYF